jgi:hypothetical protein
MVTTDIVLTPRVLDQRAFDEFSETLQHLISQSQDLAVELARQVEAASTLDTQATRASTRLQDRLHLSARMLKALQVQIDRLQSMQDEFNARRSDADKTHTQQLEALETHRGKLAAQLDERTRSTEEQLADLNDAVIKLTDLVVQSEKSITSVAYRAAQSAQRSEHVVEDAKRTLRQCEEARQQLTKELIDAEERLNESAKRADELTAKVQNAVARCEAAERQFGRIMEAAGPFVAQLDRLEQATADMNALLPMLAPWEPVLLQSRTDPQSLPAPLRELVDLVRAGLRGEMGQLAGSMRGLAERMEAMSGGTTSSGAAHRAVTVSPVLRAGAVSDVAVDQFGASSSEDGAAEIVTVPAAALAALGAMRSADAVDVASVGATANGVAKSDA